MADTATAPPDETTEPQATAPAAAPPAATADTPPPTPAPGAMGGGTAPAAAAVAATPPAAPVITVQKPGIMQSILDAFVGRTRPTIGTDEQGNKYVQQTPLTRGQQWEKIAGEALVGGLKGMAAGRGRGNLGAAGAAGVDEGVKLGQQQQQQQKDLTEQARQQNLDAANHQMLVMKQAEMAFKQTRLQVQATQQDIKFAQEQADYYEKNGGKLLGVMRTHGGGELAAILQKNPDVMKEMVQNGTIKTPPHYDENGKPDGISVYQMPHDFNKDIAPAGSAFFTFDPIKNELVQHMASDAMTKGQLDGYNMAAFAAKADFNNKKATNDHLAAKTAAENARAANAPLEGQEMRARAAQAYAAAGKDRAEMQAADQKRAQANDPALVDEIGTGKMPVGRLGYLLARNPDLMAAVAAKYPGFDGSKVDAYENTYKDFTSGKTSVALNSGATALKHLNELNDLNTVASHIYGTPAYNRYQNKADTVASELASFYGTKTIPAIAEIKKTLTSTLPFNRKAAIETQAKSMGDKFDSYEQQWKNAAPSSAYEAPLPGIDQKAMDARAVLDPDYRARAVQQQAPPADPTLHTNPQTGQQIVLRNNQWVDAKTLKPVQ